MAAKKAVMKTVKKAVMKKSKDAKSGGDDASKKMAGEQALTKESLRAHEALIAKNLKTPDEIIECVEKLPPQDKEQIWKQSLFCT